jgi:hypothetical protein
MEVNFIHAIVSHERDHEVSNIPLARRPGPLLLSLFVCKGCADSGDEVRQTRSLSKPNQPLHRPRGTCRLHALQHNTHPSSPMRNMVSRNQATGSRHKGCGRCDLLEFRTGFKLAEACASESDK